MDQTPTPPNPAQTPNPGDKQKFLISLGIAGVVVVLVFVLLFNKGEEDLTKQHLQPLGNLPVSDENPQNENSEASEASPPAATGDINDVEAALIQDSQGEFNLVEEFDDSDILTSDSDIINSYANIYNESEF